MSLGVAGLGLSREVIDGVTEARLLEQIDAAPWSDELARRVQHYGWRYDYKGRGVGEALGPLPEWAATLAQRLADEGRFLRVPDQVIVNEYLPGQGIAPHVDSPVFGEVVASLSLGGDVTMTDDTALATYIGFLKQAEIWGEDSAHSMVIRYPDNVAAWYERGQLMYRVGDWQIAEASYARVLELAAAAGDTAPGAVATAHFQRGVIADETGDAVAAVQHYDHALALERDDADAWLNRGNSLMQLRRFDDALASYERAGRLEVSAAVDERRAMALVCLGRLSEANALFHPRDAVWAEEQVTEGLRTLTLRYLATTEFAAPLRNAARMVLQVAVDVANEWRDGYRLHVGGATFTLRGDGDVFVVAEPDWQRRDVTRCVREYITTSLRELLLGLSLADQLGAPPTDSFLDDEVEITTEWDGSGAWQMMRCAERWTAVEQVVWQIAVPQKSTLPADARRRLPLVQVLKRVPQLRSLTLVPLGFGVLVEAGAPAAILNRHGAEVRDLRDLRPN